MKKLLFSIAFACAFIMSTTISNAQERPIRIGFKFGVPQIAGLNIEYVTPLLNKKLSFDADISYIPISAGSAKLSINNMGIYANYYFFNEGRGLYGGIGFDYLNLSATQDMTVTAGSETVNASGKGSLGISMANLKIGGKHGGLFYFRWELGYALALGSADLEVSASATSSTGVAATKSEKVSVPYSGGPIANIGFGFSF